MNCQCASVVVLVSLLLGLTGCDNTTVAFCSGGERFCENFLLKIGPDEDPEDDAAADPEEPPGQPAAESVEAALKVARLTPQRIDSALAYDEMDALVAEEPELVGLWLIDATLASLRGGGDNLITTDYLDRNRSWLSTNIAAGKDRAAVDVLAAGLELFAAFADERDPSSAAAGLALAGRLREGEHEADEIAIVAIDGAAQLVREAARSPEDCCTSVVLAASAVVLCTADGADEILSRAVPDGVGQRACAYAHRELHFSQISS